MKEEAEELRKVNCQQDEVIQELEERLHHISQFDRQPPMLKKARSATTQNFLTMASENYPITMNTMVDRSLHASNEESSKLA